MSKHKKSKHEAGGKKKLRKGRVEAVERIGEQFQLIEISAKACRDVKWQPGMKIKIDVGEGETRSYTPITIDAESGRIQILAYIHGDSPGSQWALAVVAGDKTHTSVPSSSLPFDDLRAPIAFFGDETSFGTAKNLQLHVGSAFPTYCVFVLLTIRSGPPAMFNFGSPVSLSCLVSPSFRALCI